MTGYRARVVRAPRLRLRLPVRLELPEQVLDAVTGNLSSGGMMVLVPAGAASGLEALPKSPVLLQLGVELPGTAGPFRCRARVAWLDSDAVNHRGEPCWRVGLQLGPLTQQHREQLATTLQSWRPTVLVVKGSQPTIRALQLHLGAELVAVATAEAALQHLDRYQVAVLLCGEHLAGAAAAELLTLATNRFPRAETVNLVLAAGDDPAPFQELVDEDRLLYLSRAPLPGPELVALVKGALADHEAQQPRQGSSWRLDSGAVALHVKRALSMARQLTRTEDPEAAATLVTETVTEVLAADRVLLLVHDRFDQTLTALGEEQPRVESAAAGLVGFVTRSGLPVLVPEARDDARYDQEADDPAGGGDEQLLLCPMIGDGRRVLGVLVAVRARGRPGFLQDELDSMTLLAAQAAVALQRLTVEQELAAITARALAAEQGQTADIFRQEALSYHQGQRVEGRLLDLSPAWTRWAYWLLLLVTLAGLAFLALGRVHEYAEGPAVVRVNGRAEATIVALVPGQYRPQLNVGARLRFEVTGYEHAYQLLEVDQIGDEVLSPAAARPLLGLDADDGVVLAGPVVVIEAVIGAPVFTAGGRQYRLYDGMLGTAEVQVRSQSILVTLIPALRAVLEPAHG